MATNWEKFFKTFAWMLFAGFLAVYLANNYDPISNLVLPRGVK